MADNIDKEFYLTRGEYAKKIGKSKGSVIQSMRRGGLTNEYIIRDSKYYFRDPQRPRAFKESVHGPLYTPKRKINRGNHDKAHYPNDAFRQHNEIKRLSAIQYKVPKRIQDKIPKAIERIEKEEREAMQKVVRKYPNYDLGPVKNPFDRRYGGMLTQREMRATDFEPTNYGNKKGKKEYY